MGWFLKGLLLKCKGIAWTWNGALACPRICHQSLARGQLLSNCAPQSLQVPYDLLHSSRSLACADFHIKFPLKRRFIAFKMFANEALTISHKTYLLQPALGRSQALNNARFDTGPQDQNSVPLVKTDTQLSRGPRESVLWWLFPGDKVCASFPTIAHRTQVQAGMGTQNKP